MKINEIVGHNIAVIEDDENGEGFTLRFDNGQLLFITTGDEIYGGSSVGMIDDVSSLVGKGISGVDYEDDELTMLFLDGTKAIFLTTDVTDIDGQKVELEDPEAGADMTDVDENEQDDPETSEEDYVEDVDDTGEESTGIPDEIED